MPRLGTGPGSTTWGPLERFLADSGVLSMPIRVDYGFNFRAGLASLAGPHARLGTALVE